jgi:hypothetical protein
MTWNYRVMKITQNHETTYGIHEVYYSPDGKPQLYSADPVPVFASSFESLKEEAKRCHDALNKAVLTPEDFPNMPVYSNSSSEDV